MANSGGGGIVQEGSRGMEQAETTCKSTINGCTDDNLGHTKRQLKKGKDFVVNSQSTCGSNMDDNAEIMVTKYDFNDKFGSRDAFSGHVKVKKEWHKYALEQFEQSDGSDSKASVAWPRKSKIEPVKMVLMNGKEEYPKESIKSYGIAYHRTRAMEECIRAVEKREKESRGLHHYHHHQASSDDKEEEGDEDGWSPRDEFKDPLMKNPSVDQSTCGAGSRLDFLKRRLHPGRVKGGWIPLESRGPSMVMDMFTHIFPQMVHNPHAAECKEEAMEEVIVRKEWGRTDWIALRGE
ncbi:hypothetical protein F5I97DRAFT_1830699 [Phlebopus sp. FC_14]|nr:hypothetical protein F5I97DRAFT_1830699 [Phlebopus sp. FC_14]